jgi:hypothetical protein
VAVDNILGIQKHSKVYEYKTDFTMLLLVWRRCEEPDACVDSLSV